MRPTAVLAALAAAIALPALARQAVLYESPGLRGRSVTIDREAPNLAYHGFANRASSMYVMSGDWEFCTQPYFRGRCSTYGPGEYPSLGGQANRVASARPVDGAIAGPGSAADGDVTLFDRRNFQGPMRTLTGPAPDFEQLRINDAAASLVVRGGNWELCTDARFRGDCRVYGPGEYAAIPFGHDDAYSSARPVARAAGVPVAGGAWRPTGEAEVILYDRRSFEGPLRTLRRATPDFGRLGANDAAASIDVRRGTWEFCTDANYRGECRIYGPGRYPAIPAGQDDRYSSARPVEGGWTAGRPGLRPGSPRGSAGPVRLRLFEFPQFGGRSIWIRSSTPDLERAGFNDRAGSAIVEGGLWRLCSDAGQQGECVDFRPGQYPVLPPALRARVSSAYTR